MNRVQLKGFLMALSAGILWGISDSCGQYVFSHYDFSAKWLTVIRMISAGTILCCWNAIRHRDAFTGVWKDKKDAVQILLFAVCGLMLSQYTTFEAIRQTNAGTATVLQSLSPVILLVWTCLVGKKLPAGKEAFALVAALLGVFLLATHGNIREMVLSPSGLFWGLMSGMTAAGYTLLSARLVKKYSSIVTVGYGLLIGGIVLACVTQIWTLPLQLGTDGWLAVAGTVCLGTIFTYSLYVSGCAAIGPVKGSLLALMEPAVATLLAVFWLGSSFTDMDFCGLVCIFGAAALLTMKS